jgi:hypothetical protein
MELCPAEENGWQMAVLHAPENAGPGSLADLSRFLQDKGLFIVPGFAGWPGRWVLRVAEFENPEYLTKLLKEEFPLWQASQPDAQAIRISQDLEITELLPPEPEVSGQGWVDNLRRRFGHKTGPMAGAAYNTGNVLMLVSALTQRGPDGEHRIDVPRIASALLFILSSSVVMAHGGQPDCPESLSDIVGKVVAQVPDDTVRAEFEAKRPVLEKWLEPVLHAAENNPWEVKAIMETLAGAGMVASGIRSGSALTAASAMVGMASLGVQMLPPRYRQPLIDLHWFKDAADRAGFGGWLTETKEKPGFLGGVLRVAREGFHWLQDNTLMVSGILAAASSIGYAISGLFNKRDRGISAGGLAVLAGNILQTFSTQTPGYNRGDIGFASALAAENADITLNGFSRQEALHMGRLLEARPEITQNPKALADELLSIRDLHSRRGEISIDRPDSYLAAYPQWDALRQRDFYRNPFVPQVAQAEVAAALETRLG